AKRTLRAAAGQRAVHPRDADARLSANVEGHRQGHPARLGRREHQIHRPGRVGSVPRALADPGRSEGTPHDASIGTAHRRREARKRARDRRGLRTRPSSAATGMAGATARLSASLRGPRVALVYERDQPVFIGDASQLSETRS
ncbi:hypothetical protein ABE10_00670, partial [Bacillus toyonensis]|nr:hypothetical protein [Bacillus toyonensis]